LTSDVKGVILSGSPSSVREAGSPRIDLDSLRKKVPLLGVCYGAQLLASEGGGEVLPSKIREYGRATLKTVDASCALFQNIHPDSIVWMSHGDTISTVPPEYKVVAGTSDVNVAAYQINNEPTFGIQFHPEVTHSQDGKILLRNFVVGICGCSQDWTPASFIDETISGLKEQIGNDYYTAPLERIYIVFSLTTDYYVIKSTNKCWIPIVTWD
jgi:GMP synthase (glutamine-hydrolysing)